MSNPHNASIALLLEARRQAIKAHADLRQKRDLCSKSLATLTASVDELRTNVAQYEATLALLGHVDPPHPLHPES